MVEVGADEVVVVAVGPVRGQAWTLGNTTAHFTRLGSCQLYRKSQQPIERMHKFMYDNKNIISGAQLPTWR